MIDHNPNHSVNARSKAPGELAIQSWLIQQIAGATGLNPDDVDIFISFANYGLNSVDTIRLIGELESWLGLELPVTLPWEYPTIERLAKHLSFQLRRNA